MDNNDNDNYKLQITNSIRNSRATSISGFFSIAPKKVNLKKNEHSAFERQRKKSWTIGLESTSISS